MKKIITLILGIVASCLLTNAQNIGGAPYTTGNLSIGNHFTFNHPTAGVINWGGNGVGDLYFRRLNSQNTPYGGHSNLMIIKGDGKVGIGVTSPLTRFHVVGDFSVFSSSVTPTFSAAIRCNSNNSLASTPDYTWYNDDQTGMYHPSSFTIGFTSGGSEKMRIDNSGRVVIGGSTITNLPSGYKLYVTSGIYTEQVRVATYPNWADYVFDEKYQLMSLDSLNQYVQQNKHLPNIPSADEIAKEGIDLADMDAKLLEKIEELTLYIIQLENRIRELEK